MNMRKSTDSPTLPSNPEPARPAAPTEKDLIEHCIQFMADKEDIKKLFDKNGIQIPSKDTYKVLAEEAGNCETLHIEDIRSMLRDQWMEKRKSFRMNDLLANLKSGELEGHDWHKTRPSSLHLSIQDMVRNCFDEKFSLSDYLSKGMDIIKHEYFMTAIHDICEVLIVRGFSDVIPPTRKKSVSDFVFDGIPYDLKVTTIKSNPEKWKQKAGRMTLDDKKQLAQELYDRADSKRMRKDAEQCRHNWGLNRMFYVVGDQDKWLKDPEGTVQYLLEGLDDRNNFFEMEVEEHKKGRKGRKNRILRKYRVQVCLVEQ